LEFYKNFAEEVDPKIYTDKAGIWFRRVREDLDNLRVATEWATNTGNAIAALQIAGSLISFIFVHGPLLSEWYDRIKIALARPEGKERTFARAKALSGIGYMLLAQVYPTEDVRPGLEEALSIGEELDDQWIIATALRNLGLFTSLQGNYVEARSFFEKSLENWREMGTVGKSGCAWTLMLLGDTAFNQVEMTWARSLYQEATTILREIGDINFLAYSVRRLGLLAWREGDYVQAAPLCKESLLLNQEAGDRRGMIACLAGFAAIGIIQGKLEYAAKLMAAVDTQLALIGIKLLHVDQTEYERNLTLLRTELDEKTLSKFWRKGKRMSLEQAIALALEEK
jgi:tetratricopeptide (TPR) repeat protein